MFNPYGSTWHRQEHFDHYMHNSRCTYSMTVQIEITTLHDHLIAKGIKLYPTLIYMLATTVNQFPEFRMGLSQADEPGYWDSMNPSYTVFNPQLKTFSSIWTPYDRDFSRFYFSCVEDMQRYGTSAEFFPKKNMPPNVFNVSCIPWIEFSAFNLNVYTEGTYLPPIFTIGKYVERGGKTLLPLALQLHHAACDGYHTGQFIVAMKDLAVNMAQWL